MLPSLPDTATHTGGLASASCGRGASATSTSDGLGSSRGRTMATIVSVAIGEG